MAIGAYGNDGNGSDAGHVRIYKNISGTWTQQGSDIDGEAAGDHSGYSVSLSSDGSTVAIGAIGNDGNGSNAGHLRDILIIACPTTYFYRHHHLLRTLHLDSMAVTYTEQVNNDSYRHLCECSWVR